MSLAESEASDGFTLTDEIFETPFYRLEFKAGRLIRWTDLKHNRLLAEDDNWGVHNLVRERIAEGQAQNRSTFFPRDIDKGNFSESVWNHDWEADRAPLDAETELKLTVGAGFARLERRWEKAIGLTDIRISYLFYETSPQVEVDVSFELAGTVEPLSYYMTFPVALTKDWTAHYDTAGVPVRLEDEQIGRVSRDWVTVDSYYAIDDQDGGLLIAGSDARLVQTDGFGFGRESAELKREERPLVLSWLVNNYWDTNFNARTDGRLRYHYVLEPYETFDPVAAHRLGTLAAGPLQTVQAKALPERHVYQWHSEHLVLEFIKPHLEGVILALRNTADEEAEAVFTPLEKQITRAYRTRPDGKLLEELSSDNNEFRYRARGGELAFIYLELKGEER